MVYILCPILYLFIYILFLYTEYIGQPVYSNGRRKNSVKENPLKTEEKLRKLYH